MRMNEGKKHIDYLEEELLNELSGPGRQALDELTSENQVADNFHRLLREMKLTSGIEQKGLAMKEDILKRVNELIDKENRKRLRLRISSVAASILVLLGISNYLSYHYGFSQVNSQIVEMTNPLGMRSSLTLPDGSKVVLNGGTTISYPSFFVSKNREVKIKGEAFFEVVTDEKRPFIVEAENIQIHVLGTEFNVKAYEEEDRVEVSLVKGRVGVRQVHQTELIPISSGQQVYFDKNARMFSIRDINLLHYTSWKEGVYYFNALPLKEIARQLERGFNVDIHIDSPGMEQIVLTGDFVRGENLEQILRIMTADQRMKYRIDGDQIYIDEK